MARLPPELLGRPAAPTPNNANRLQVYLCYDSRQSDLLDPSSNATGGSYKWLDSDTQDYLSQKLPFCH